jgi:hypothetical protein
MMLPTVLRTPFGPGFMTMLLERANDRLTALEHQGLYPHEAIEEPRE